MQITSADDLIFWYGPIPFTDLDVFVEALPEDEAQEFIAAVKGETDDV